MHLPGPYLRYIILVLCLVIVTKSFSQTDTEASAIQQLIAFQKQVIKSDIILKPASCNSSNELGIEELIKQALWYNAHGNWLCGRQMLRSVIENRLKLSSQEACHYYLAWGEYYAFHQSFDSAKLYAELANRMAGERKWKYEKARHCCYYQPALYEEET